MIAMREADAERPPDPDSPDGPDGPDGSAASWWAEFDTVGWAAQRRDAHVLRQRDRLFAVLDLLIGRCSAQLYPGGRFTAPDRGTAARIRRRQRHVVAIRDRVTSNPEVTVAELHRLLQVYGPLARATHHGPIGPIGPTGPTGPTGTAVDEQLDHLADP